MRRIALVGCGKAKAAIPLPAAQLYTGSLFRASLEYAQRTSDQQFVLSARHGLVPLERVIAPYDMKLGGKVAELDAWTNRVMRDLLTIVRPTPADPIEVTLLAGQPYVRWMRAALVSHNVAWPEQKGSIPAVHAPLDGMGIGARMAWLTRSES